MKKSIIHVNRQLIAANIKRPKNKQLPVYTVKSGNKNTYGYGIKINGPSVLIDIRDHEQLSCGARAWIETTSPVEIIGAMPYSKVKELKKK